MVVGGSQQKTLDPGFVLLTTSNHHLKQWHVSVLAEIYYCYYYFSEDDLREMKGLLSFRVNFRPSMVLKVGYSTINGQKFSAECAVSKFSDLQLS
ncbi:unnamed protein product [Schistosoma margrebowiei]|uniref:Uncharacterized protein n=1 Tax=Schistosoma margrebowiei TaxID=48269 RepID=A0A183LGF3_9TREM|nr:unnamed protein product [Schistosoma margrebowiei]